MTVENNLMQKIKQSRLFRVTSSIHQVLSQYNENTDKNTHIFMKMADLCYTIGK